MTKGKLAIIQILPRHQINDPAWDSCVANSPQCILYGYTWYLDIVLPAPLWKWMGLIIADEAGHYLAVMPLPLRQKRVFGMPYRWVVHQPFFCQFLDVFSPDITHDSTPFMQLVQQHFRYGSTLCIRQLPDAGRLLPFEKIDTNATQVLGLSKGYDALYQRYSYDRKYNLKRALAAHWTIIESDDPEPLITLFQKNHADRIDGGVANWAYDILRNLTTELTRRKLLTLRYALQHGRIEAGALFVCDRNRIIYLFNAASEIGRRGNARILLIDQMIRQKAGMPFLFDFESPSKPTIRQFYQSFGADEEPFYGLRWNRLTLIENLLRTSRRLLR